MTRSILTYTMLTSLAILIGLMGYFYMFLNDPIENRLYLSQVIPFGGLIVFILSLLRAFSLYKESNEYGNHSLMQPFLLILLGGVFLYFCTYTSLQFKNSYLDVKAEADQHQTEVRQSIETKK